MERIGQRVQVDDPTALPVVPGYPRRPPSRCNQHLVEGETLPTAQNNLRALASSEVTRVPVRTRTPSWESLSLSGEDLFWPEPTGQKFP